MSPDVTVCVPALSHRAAWHPELSAVLRAQAPVIWETTHTGTTREEVARWRSAAVGDLASAARSRNRLLQQVCTPWVAFVDDDDLPGSAWVADSLAILERTGADIVCAAWSHPRGYASVSCSVGRTFTWNVTRWRPGRLIDPAARVSRSPSWSPDDVETEMALDRNGYRVLKPGNPPLDPGRPAWPTLLKRPDDSLSALRHKLDREASDD